MRAVLASGRATTGFRITSKGGESPTGGAGEEGVSASGRLWSHSRAFHTATGLRGYDRTHAGGCFPILIVAFLFQAISSPGLRIRVAGRVGRFRSGR